MNFAVLQKSLDIPRVEKSEQALLSVPGFTRVDAQIFANDAYGILVRNISAERANAFSQALLGQGIETEVVAEKELVALPPTKFVHRLDCNLEALLIYDPLGRSFPLEWKYVMLIAAGCVRVMDFKRVEKPSWSTVSSEGGAYETTSIYNVEERHDQLLLEIVVTGAVLRYSVNAENFRFDYLGGERTKSSQENFARLVQDIVAFAPHAALNRGAFSVKQNQTLFFYPSKNAFFEEITWLLWRTKGGTSGK